MPTAKFPGRPLLSYPVISHFYKVFYAGTILIRLPIWIAGSALFKGARPLPTWTIKQAVMVRLFNKILNILSRTETPVPLPLEPGKEKDRWVTFEPFPEDVYRGPLASESVKPAVIGGTWYPQKPADAAAAGTVLLHLHGGGFVIGDGRTGDSGPMFDLFLKHAGVGHVFAPQYRLSSRPTNAPFPAAVQDALTSYLYLVRTLGVAPSSIVLSGDSAGGNLVIALLRYLAEHGGALGLPAPRCAVAVTPWVAPHKHLWPAAVITGNPNYGSDYIGTALCLWGARTYIPPASPEHPYIVPLGQPFRLPVPVLATFGGAEVILADGLEWAGEMSVVEGNEVETFVEPDAPHDTVLVGHSIGFEESAATVAARMGEFITKHA
ncbi:alpha/beta hydrolase fold-3 domain-containing protein [Xylaria palmicola]|nr:alpha/beta hydrolase fold-3 domain-containing protein [Xylaria palmicola]